MARTITYFYKLDESKSGLMVADIVTGTRRAISTVYMWMRGERQPCYLEKKHIQRAVKKYYGEDIPIEELFPAQN